MASGCVAGKGSCDFAQVHCMPGQSHPTRVEGFGWSYLEAAAQGTPSIATPMGGVPEVIRDRETGTIVQPNDAEGLAAALRVMLTDAALLQRLSLAAKRHAAAFSWAGCIAATYEGLNLERHSVEQLAQSSY
jgi:phosphatidyl-myo-inositol dimannoside synthase